jgi:hypothetical protein
VFLGTVACLPFPWVCFVLINMSTTEETKPAIAATEDEKTATVSSEKAAAHSDSEDENTPAHLHAKTWLAVLAVCLIYFAQLVNLVGAGAVRRSLNCRA